MADKRYIKGSIKFAKETGYTNYKGCNLALFFEKLCKVFP